MKPKHLYIHGELEAKCIKLYKGNIFSDVKSPKVFLSFSFPL